MKKKLINFMFIYFIIMLLLGSCSTTISGEYGEEFQLKEGEKAQIHDITVTFVRVKEDSRCPIDAQCIWHGIGVVELEVYHDGQKYEIELATISLSSKYSEAETNSSFGPYTIALIELNPYPETTTKSNDYIVTLVVT